MPDYSQTINKIEKHINRNSINSLSSCLFNKDEVLFSYSSGIARKSYDKGVDHRYASLDTKYQIGTFTKLLTAIAIMQLKDKGKLSLFDDIRKHLKDFTIKKRYNENEIAIRDILNERSGIPSSNYNLYTKNSENDYHDVVEYLKDQYVICPPNAMEAKSDLGYTLLGIVIEELTSMRYIDYINEFIFKPLDIEAIFIEKEEDYKKYKNILDASYDAFGQEVIEPIKCLIPSRSNICLSVNDMAKIVSLFLNEGKYEGKEVVSNKSIETMLEEPAFKNEVPNISKIGNALTFSHKYDSSLGLTIFVSGENIYNQIFITILKEKGICCVVAGDSYNGIEKIEDVCIDILKKTTNTEYKSSTSSSAKTNYLQCRIEDYAGVYPSTNKQALIYLGNHLTLAYKNKKYRMRLKQDGYFELEERKYFFKKIKNKCALVDKNGLLSIYTKKDNGDLEVDVVGYQARTDDINPSWKKALGVYRISQFDESNPRLYEKMTLTIENGYLMMILQRNCTKRFVTAGVINNKEAIALGYGTESYDTISLHLSNIKYCGMSFYKVRESSLNKEKVKKVNTEREARREQKKKIDKMFDFK